MPATVPGAFCLASLVSDWESDYFGALTKTSSLSLKVSNAEVCQSHPNTMQIEPLAPLLPPL